MTNQYICSMKCEKHKKLCIFISTHKEQKYKGTSVNAYNEHILLTHQSSTNTTAYAEHILQLRKKADWTICGESLCSRMLRDIQQKGWWSSLILATLGSLRVKSVLSLMVVVHSLKHTYICTLMYMLKVRGHVIYKEPDYLWSKRK